MNDKYKVLRATGSLPVLVDQIVYPAGCDYGLASDDTRATGIEHISVSLYPSGIPSFTIPRADVVRIIE